MNITKLMTTILLVIVLTLTTVYYVVADPISPETLTVQSSQRSPVASSSNRTLEALAGNVTEIVINTTIVTAGWQGYYGNISGKIVLDDALNNSLYTWALTDTTGEVYASLNYSITWTSGNIVCAATENVSAMNDVIFPGTAGDDSDNFTNTFALTTHPAITVGTGTITADTCSYTVSTYVDDTSDTDRAFNETLLWSNADGVLIYTAIINDNSDGFKVGDQAYDFQMLVGEDGHAGDTATSTYYFYVELSI